MTERIAGCVHGHSPTRCWDCVPILDQMESRRIWYDLEDVPGFTVTVEQAEQEAKEGQIIRMRRPGSESRHIMICYSALREIVDLISEDKD